MTENENDDVIDKICSTALPIVTYGIRAGSTLPSSGESFEFYQSYPAFSKFARENSQKILSLIQRLAEVHGRVIKNNISVDDLVDSILDSNDHILETIGERLDEASGINDKNKPIILGEARQPKQIVSSWNRQKDKTVRIEKSVVKVKPQLMFKDKPDNSTIPFVPKLLYKPNAIVPIRKQLTEINQRRNNSLESLKVIMMSLGSNVDLEIYNHPYKEEILNSAPKEGHILASKSEKFLPLDETPLTIVNTELSLDLMIANLRQEVEIAMDLEHHSYRSYQGITCLIQISTRKEDYVIDTFALRSVLHKLNEVTTDSKICKIFHGGKQDILWLQKDFGIYVVNCFDTFFASQKLKLPKHSYDYLLQHYCSIKVDKRYQLSDWRQRPIPLEMIRYAREDTHYLIYIYDCIRRDLENEQRGDVREVFKQSREISLQKYSKQEFNEEEYMNVYKKKNKKKFNSQQLEAFRYLYAWRDQIARSEDECTDYVIPNHTLLQIAEILPREKQGILACFSYEPQLVKQNLQVLHKLIKRARETTLVQVKDDIDLTEQTSYNGDNKDIENLHDWSKSGRAQDDVNQNNTKLKKASALADGLNHLQDHFGSKQDAKKIIESSFMDPFNNSTIPYDLYLMRPNNTEDVLRDDTIMRKIWKLKKVKLADSTCRVIKSEKIKVETETPEEELSIRGMRHGKRQSTGSIPEPKKMKIEIPTHVYKREDFKIFGSHKLTKGSKRGKATKTSRRSMPNVPTGFTEPSFGIVKQTSKAVKRGIHGSFTHAK